MNILFSIPAAVIVCILFQLPQPLIEKAGWLIGTWENKTERGIIYESWIKKNDSEFLGKNYVLKGMDTVVFETIRLVQENDSLFYIPTVSNQNNALPVRFAMKSITANTMIFENKAHDFPQEISYSMINKDSMLAQISGMKNNVNRTQHFQMIRVK